MLRVPVVAAFIVLSALALAGLASGPVHAAPTHQARFAELASSEGCPYDGDAQAPATADAEHRLPPGHPPVPGYLVEGEVRGLPPGHPEVNGGARLPPGHPPVGPDARLPAPRFDAQNVIDI